MWGDDRGTEEEKEEGRREKEEKKADDKIELHHRNVEVNVKDGWSWLDDGVKKAFFCSWPVVIIPEIVRSVIECQQRHHFIPEGWKLGVVIGVIIICFSMLYPSMLHPLVSSLFRAPSTVKTGTNRPPIHPAMSSPRSRPDLHPGMRMAASQPDINTPSSSSKGMFAWMLPIYTAGVVAFLIYTLIKSKKKRRIRRHDYSSTESESDEGYIRSDGRSGGIGKRKLRGLQERLRQTEIAMEKILEQLNTISAEAANVAKQNLTKENENKESLEHSFDQQDGKTEQYLRDLEEALRDFKQLSKKYRKEGEDDDSASDEDIHTDEGVQGDENATDISEQCKLKELNSSDENLRQRRKS
uniref:Resistance to inhibitors of cholinesterase protein 3 N-terminal domain-containing protein n=1 Tax=Setaria digitata TaxID=48799 RepID=A0A915PJ68_9BILA